MLLCCECMIVKAISRQLKNGSIIAEENILLMIFLSTL